MATAAVVTVGQVPENSGVAAAQAARGGAPIGPERPVVPGERPYLDQPAKSDPGRALAEGQALPWSLAKPLLRCGRTALSGQCDCEEGWLKVVTCNREWCPDCGAKGSSVHMRRYARWLTRLRTVDSAGYLVITWPPDMREALRDPAELRRIGRVVKRVLKKLGYSKGLRRWHFFGDGGKEGHDSKLGVYHPHLNLLLGGVARIAPHELAALKTALREAIGLPANGVIHYSYREGPAALCHVARYITRATFRDAAWDPALADALAGFHNDAWWGAWTGPDLWELEGNGETGKLLTIEAGECPDCHAAIQWQGKPVRWRDLPGLLDLGNGYLRWDARAAPERGGRHRE